MLGFLIKASLVIIVLLAFYKVFLEKESFFAANRAYLLGSLVFACTLPFIVLPKLIEHQGFVDILIEIPTEKKSIFFEKTIPPTGKFSIQQEKESTNLKEITGKHPITSLEKTSSYSKLNNSIRHQTSVDRKANIKIISTKNQQSGKRFTNWLLLLYFFGFAVFLLKVLAQITYIFWMIYKSKDKIKDEGHVLVNTNNNIEPCSFFQYIFINPVNFDYEIYEQIIAHEKIHVKQWHSIDLLLAELAVVVFWFNPFIWVLRKEVEKNIEYQTDDLMIKGKTAAKENYQLNLVKIATYTQPPSITTNYNQSLITQRILKMNTKKSNPSSYWKYTFIAPMLLMLLLVLNKPSVGNAQNLNTASNTVISSEAEFSKVEKAATLSIPEPANDCEKLSKAIHEENIAAIKKLLETVDPNCIAPSGEFVGFQLEHYIQVVHTPLSAAAKIGNLEIAELLLDAGAKIDSHSVYLKSPLMAASNAGHLDFVKLLVKKGADIQSISSNHGSALHCAAKGGYIEIISYLLEQGANINAYTYLQGTPLNCAAKNKHTEIVALLIDKEAMINEPDSTQISAFTRAAGRGDNQTVELLLSKGAEINPQGSMWSALFSAARYGQTQTVALLLSKGAKINHQNNDKYGTALITASEMGHTETVDLLLSKGAKIDLQCGSLGTALIAASKMGHIEIVELLLAKGAKIDLQTDRPYSALITPAKQQGSIWEKKGKGDMQSGKKVTALIAAARNGHTKTVELLLSKGANINLQNEEQGSALNAAARNGHTKTVELLLTKGADINAQNNAQGAALNAAARNGHTKTVELLLTKGADINAQNDAQGAALNAAARNGHTKTVELLLAKGADINAQNDAQGAALNAAARNGHLATVKLLVSSGADVNLYSKGEGRAIDAAYRNAHHQVAEYLASKGAKRFNKD
jgi:ankyrin repeat protein/beta-lactamase regulating signal transducer with metallopeptidase domain